MEHKFEHHWGGEEMWYHKAERWAKKQKFPINHLALGFITWLKEQWIEGKIEMEMQSVDKQAEEIVKQWDEEDVQPEPEIVETGVFGDEGWSISISNPIVERRSEKSDTSMGPERNEV